MFTEDTSRITEPRREPTVSPGDPWPTQETITLHLDARLDLQTTQGPSSPPAWEAELDGQPQGARLAGSTHVQHSGLLPREIEAAPLVGKPPASGDDGHGTAAGSGHFRPGLPTPLTSAGTPDASPELLPARLPPGPSPFTALRRCGVKTSPSE